MTGCSQPVRDRAGEAPRGDPGGCESNGRADVGAAKSVRSPRTGIGCHGQGKTDTEGSSVRSALRIMGTDIVPIGVQPHAIGAHLAVINDVVRGFLTRGVITVRRALVLSTAQEPLGHRMVETRTLAAQTTAPPRCRQHALLRVRPQLTGGVATPQRPLHRSRPAGRLAVTAHGPPSHWTRSDGHPHGHRHPALTCPHLGDSARPHLIRRRHVTWARPPLGSPPEPGRLSVVTGPRR
jgi:hypothetical protein